MHAPARALCRLDEIPDGGSRGFGPAPGGFAGLFAVRRGERVFAYVNACPHIDVPPDWTPHQFLDADGTLVVCSVYGAEFRVVDGLCPRGPCKGDRLEAVQAEVVGGVILVPDDAGL